MQRPADKRPHRPPLKNKTHDDPSKNEKKRKPIHTPPLRIKLGKMPKRLLEKNSRTSSLAEKVLGRLSIFL